MISMHSLYFWAFQHPSSLDESPTFCTCKISPMQGRAGGMKDLYRGNAS